MYSNGMQKMEKIMKKPNFDKLLEFTPTYDSLPEEWRVIEGATNHPRGYVWICNNKSLFSPKRRTGLMKIEKGGH